MNIRQSLLISGAIAALSAGCATAPVNTAIGGNEKFAPADAAAAAALDCTDLRERTLGDGRLEVVAVIQNRTAQRVEAQVRCIFRDDLGIPTGGETHWQTIVLEGNSAEAVRFAALTPAVTRYTINVRLAR
jgi:hypothetical protein